MGSSVAVVMVVIAPLLSGCRGDKPTGSGEARAPGALEAPSAAPRQRADAARRVGATCPTAVQGVTVAAEDTDDGIALAFTTSPDDLAVVRERVQKLSELYDDIARQRRTMGWRHLAHPPGPMGGRTPHMTLMQGQLPDALTTVVPTERGARLVFEPADPANLESLRQQVREHEKRMQNGECPVLEKK